MKTHHLWVLGILLLGVLTLAFLGFFKANEGFQNVVEQWITTAPQAMANTSMTGYDWTNIRIAGATFVERATGATVATETVVQRSLPLTAGADTFLLAILELRKLKMVPVQFTKMADDGTLKVALSGSQGKVYEYPAAVTVPTVLTDAEVRSKWANASATAVGLIVGNAGVGYGIKNIQVQIVRSSTAGVPGAGTGTGTGTTNDPTKDVIRCPPGYTFFNGPSGDSMCCKGTVNPYTHQCEGVDQVRNNMCGLSASVPDPRILFKGDMLPDCRTLVTQQTSVGSSSCPPSLPNFAKKSDTEEKCCKNPVQLAGETGFTCSAEDLKSTANYCVAKGVPEINPTDGKRERLCNEATMLDTAACPLDATGKRVFQNVTYTMGDREASRYDIADLKGVQLPTCFRLNEVCIPESAIVYAKSRGAFTEYDPKTWEYSCAVWSRKNRGEIVPGTVKGYLTVPQGTSTSTRSQ